MYLPQPDPKVEENLSGVLSVEEEIIDEQEVADLLEDAKDNSGQLMELDEEGDLFYVEGPEEEHDNEEMSMCEASAAAEEEEPDLVTEPDEEFRPQRNSNPPEHYNPVSGRSYAQVVANHNVVTQVVERDNTFDYQDAKAGILARIVTHECHQQMFMLPKAKKKLRRRR